MAGGIVLAGGRSARMGLDKAVLPAGDRTMLERTVGAARAVASPIVVVAPSADSYRLADAHVIADLYPGAGPLGGIVTGLRALGDGHHVVLACDMPFVRPDVLALLLAAAQRRDGAVPEVSGWLEPLCAVYHARCAGPFAISVRAGRRAVHAALEHLDIARVPEVELRRVDPDLISFTNVNTPEDYARLAGGSTAIG